MSSIDHFIDTPDSLHISRDLLRGIVKRLKLKPLSSEVPLALGFKMTITLRPEQLDIRGDTLLVPFQAGKFSSKLVLGDISIREGLLWFHVGELRVAGKKIPGTSLLEKLAEKAGSKLAIRRDESTGEIGIPIAPNLPPDIPVVPTHIEVADAVILHLALR